MAPDKKEPDTPAGRDQWETVTGRNFKCRVLVSPYNRRLTVYEFHLSGENGAETMAQVLAEKAGVYGLDKIWLKSSTRWARAFTKAGLKLEAKIPGYFKNRETANIFAMYLNTQRATPSSGKTGHRLNSVKPVPGPPGGTSKQVPPGVTLKWGAEEDSDALARLYRKVYTTYPFPVFAPDYLRQTMDNDVCYLAAWHNEQPVAAASAEINRPEENAELTDFATLPSWRGHGLASLLLSLLETRLKKEGIRCLYTIARSSSTGMNRVFAGAGYAFQGVLVNNCNIGGDFEDMYVYSKMV